jgi:hypothetical protein
MCSKYHAEICTSISDAIDQMETEYSRLAAEQTAFDRFASRVENLSPDRRPSQDQRVGYDQQVAPQTLSVVREAYSETVMDLSHYEDDYDDSYEESVTEEFGPELAVLLTKSDHFLPATKATLVDKIDIAIQQRDAFQRVVDRELQSLRSAATDIRPVTDTLEELSETTFESSSFGALDAYYQQTDVLFTECDAIASDRQDDLVTIQRSWQSNASLRALVDYFYQSLQVTYPVLFAIGELGQIIIKVRREIEQTIICGEEF